MVKILLITITVFTVSENLYAQPLGYSMTVEGGRGLMYMQSARTFGQGMLVYGMKSLTMKRETQITSSLRKKDFPSIIGIPITYGLTDEIDITAGLYGFHDTRILKNFHNILSGYSSPESGIDETLIGVKIRLPLSERSRFQFAGKFCAIFDFSSKQIDGMNYRWAQDGTNIETSLYQTIDLNPRVSLHFEEGYIVSGSDLFNDQIVGGIGLEVRAHRKLSFNLEIINRTFLGVSPHSLWKAWDNPYYYHIRNGIPAVGETAELKDNIADFFDDFFILTPSLVFKCNEHITFDIGSIINIADQVRNKEPYQIVVGLTFTSPITPVIDRDRDGIKNQFDIEPHTPRGFPVDTFGKSLDTDGDGVPDGRDSEPNTLKGAVVNSHGIGIDSDGDGVLDGLDREPITPKGYPVDKSGVSLDDDRDGVPNAIDKEPTTPDGAIVDHDGIALDDDGDGVPDGIDTEPHTPKGALVDRNGVALDNDGDGIPDGIDREPNTPKGLTVDGEGRSLAQEEFHLLVDGFIRFNTIFFTPGNSTLKLESYQILDEVGRILQKYPNLKIQIEGHTDNTGDRITNLRLARERARVVLDYLVQLYPKLQRNRFRVIGFGSDKPIASNESLQGREMNRRVDFVVINRDELIKFH